METFDKRLAELPKGVQRRVYTVQRKKYINDCLQILKKILSIFDNPGCKLCRDRSYFEHEFLENRYFFRDQLHGLVQQMMRQDCFINLLNTIGTGDISKFKTAYQNVQNSQNFTNDLLWELYRQYRQPKGKNDFQLSSEQRSGHLTWD